MRVTNTAITRNYTNKMNSVQQRLNKSINKIGGKAYETAAESPLSYYTGKEIDNQFQEALSKSRLLTDVKSRLYQQEKGAYDIQTTLSAAKNDIVLKSTTATTSDTALATLREDLLQKEHNIVNDLLTQYQGFYIYGGNDISTPPFNLSSDGKTLTYSHVFPGETNVTEFTMELINGKFELTSGNGQDLIRAMSEQGYMDLGYGDIRDRSSLLDTYTGGMNILTGITSEAVKTGAVSEADIMEALTNGPLGLTAKAITSLDTYLNSGSSDRTTLNKELGDIVDQMTVSEHTTSTVYSDLGNKYNLLEKMETKLKGIQDSLTEQYTNTVGVDPYTAIYEMYNNQYSYSAALQVGSNILGSSLFDFMR